MRKLYISLGLALLLLLAQQGAVLHEVTHINAAAGAHVQARVQADIALDKGCQLCLGYSQIANPAGNTVSLTRFLPSACTAELLPAWAITPRDVLNPRSRGPPLPHSNV
jgi:hypothetical protein